jgi:hypothetical protein
MPVVEVGKEEPPKQGKYILFLRAGQVVSFKLALKGSLFAEADNAELKVKLARDLYLYDGSWASLDKKEWKAVHKLIGIKTTAEWKREGLTVGFQFNQKPSVQAE